MKVLSSSQIREADQYTIRHEPIQSIDLMERASVACVNKLLEIYPNQSHYSIYCGTGNNGGDGFAIARLLITKSINVDVTLVRFSEQLSPDNTINLEKLSRLGVSVVECTSNQVFDTPPKNTIIIDALVGNGLTRPLDGQLLDIVTFLNKQSCRRVAIDIPSGMFCELENSGSMNAIFMADVTLTFEAPKLSFFFPSLQHFVGSWHLLDIGLEKAYIEKMESQNTLVDQTFASSLIKIREQFSHKGTFGHALIVSGSYGKMGAAVLASSACIHSGAGLVSAFIPSCGYEILQTSVPEVMVHAAKSEMTLSGKIDYSTYNAIGVGPGIGQNDSTLKSLQLILEEALSPLVLDADALNLLSRNRNLFDIIPKNSILTPHRKEFERLFGTAKSDFEYLQLQRTVSEKYGLYIVFKGKYTSTSCPNGEVYFNNTGNPGMATAGSGDVLTGIITGLLCQGYSAKDAAILGVYIHGLAADLYVNDFAEETLIASEITNYLGQAFHLLHKKD